MIYDGKMDAECVALCDAINRFPGIQTTESCCGHAKRTFDIWFTVRSLDDLPALLYWFNGCHSGIYGWHVVIRTDCAQSPVSFCAESEAMGQDAYDGAAVIAHHMNEHGHD